MACNSSAPFWTYRLGSIGLILAAVLLLMVAFGATVVLSSIQHFVVERLPGSSGLGDPARHLPDRPGGDAVRHLLRHSSSP